MSISDAQEVSVREILEAFADRSAIEQVFHDVKGVWGAGQKAGATLLGERRGVVPEPLDAHPGGTVGVEQTEPDTVRPQCLALGRSRPTVFPGRLSQGIASAWCLGTEYSAIAHRWHLPRSTLAMCSDWSSLLSNRTALLESASFVTPWSDHDKIFRVGCTSLPPRCPATSDVGKMTSSKFLDGGRRRRRSRQAAWHRLVPFAFEAGFANVYNTNSN